MDYFQTLIFFIFLDKKLPLLVFGVLSIVGGFLALPLPETRHRPLPETIDDVEHYEEFCRFVLICRTIKFTFYVSVNNNKDRLTLCMQICFVMAIDQEHFLKFPEISLRVQGADCMICLFISHMHTLKWCSLCPYC